MDDAKHIRQELTKHPDLKEAVQLLREAIEVDNIEDL